MRNHDLPEPTPRVYDAEARRLRQWKLLSTVTLFVIAYSTLHKLVIPLCLRLTTITNANYTTVDPWVVHTILFGIVLWKSSRPHFLLLILAALAILAGTWEAFDVFSGHATGWMALSHLLSSFPLALCGIAVLTVGEGK